MSSTTIYDFLKGKGGKQLTAANLGYVLDALGITLTPTAPDPPDPEKGQPSKRKTK